MISDSMHQAKRAVYCNELQIILVKLISNKAFIYSLLFVTCIMTKRLIQGDIKVL